MLTPDETSNKIRIHDASFMDNAATVNYMGTSRWVAENASELETKTNPLTRANNNPPRKSTTGPKTNVQQEISMSSLRKGGAPSTMY